MIWDRNVFTYRGRFFGLAKVSDGNYIFSGSNADSSQNYMAKLLLVKFDTGGNVLWQKNLLPATSGPNSDSYVWCVRSPAPDEFVFSAYISNPIPTTLIGKSDLNGNILWTRQYRSTFHTFNYLPTNFETTTDGGFVLDIDAGTFTNGTSTYSNAFLKLDENGYNACEGSAYSLQLKSLNYVPASGINTYSCGTASAYNPTITTVVIKDSILCETITDHAPPSSVGLMEHNGDYSLFQNYPNPSNGVTRIGYSLARSASTVFIELYDSKGSLVFKKELGKQAKGNYSEALNLRLDAGIYIYLLNVDGIRKSKRMLVE